MAGNYPDAPSYRLAYDKDGTQGYRNGQPPAQMSQGDLAALNDESGSEIRLSGSQGFTLIFPQMMDIDAYVLQYHGDYRGIGTCYSIQVSSDTTNGVDGTWTTLESTPTYLEGFSQSGMRSPTQKTALNVIAIKWNGSANGYGADSLVYAFHIFGEPVPGENPDRLEIWHPTDDVRIAPSYFDWGDTPRESSADKKFRVKNMSSAKTARSIRVAMEALTDTNPSVPGQHSVSTDDSAFYAQTNIGDLGPGAISAPVTLRRVTPSNAVLSLWWLRVFAEAAVWN